jgi:hypothetical protein
MASQHAEGLGPGSGAPASLLFQNSPKLYSDQSFTQLDASIGARPALEALP